MERVLKWASGSARAGGLRTSRWPSLLAWVVVLLAAAPASALFGCGLNPFCLGGKAIGGATSSIAGDAITALAKAILGALGTRSSGPRRCGWGWARRRSPTPVGAGDRDGRVPAAEPARVHHRAGGAVARCSAPARIVYHEHKAAQLRELGRYLATYALVSSAAAAAASVLIGGCDQMASWFISQASANSNFANHLANLLGLATLSSSHAAGAPAGFTVGLAGTVTTAFIAIVLGIIAFLATVIQIMLMLVRGGMLVLLVGTLPLVAAFSNTEMGHQWFRKACAWLLAFALYKPAAAIVYAVAFDLAGQPGALALLDGVMMLVLAILALPALLRFVVPGHERAGGRRRGGSDARRRGGRRDRDADADRRGLGRLDARQRLRPGAGRRERSERRELDGERAAAAPWRRPAAVGQPAASAPTGRRARPGSGGGARQRPGRRVVRRRRARRRRRGCGSRGQRGRRGQRGAAGAAAATAGSGRR